MNDAEPSMTPRNVQPRMMGCCAGVQGLRRCDAACGDRRTCAGRVGHRSPRGKEGTPPRPHLVRVERDNPVGVRSLVTGAGKPTVREAQLPSGQRMAKKRMPASRKATGNRDTHGRPSADRLG